METLKFGFKYWKRNVPGAIFTQVVSFLAIIADLMIPMLSGILEFFMRTGMVLGLTRLIGSDGIFWAEISAWIGAAVLLGISYYLSRQDFRNLVAAIASISCEGSSICFDYPVSESGAESQRNRELAAAAGEMMKAKYSYEEMEALLSNAGFLIYEHMDADEATDELLKESGMTAPAGVGYCLAVKK